MQQNFSQLIIAISFIPILLFIYWRIRLKKLKVYQSKILGKIEVFEKYNKERVLTTNSYIQGVSIHDKSIEKSYWFTVAEYATKFCEHKKDPKVLTLGLGANTIPNLIAKLNPKIYQTIIEIDNFITQACQEFFDLDKLPDYQLIQADAYQLFNGKKVPNQPFDAIVVDIFTGEPPYVDLKSNKPNFILKLLPYLKKNGVMVFNRPAHNKKVRAGGQQLKNYLATIFKETEIIDIKDPRGFRNHVILGKEKLTGN